MGKTTGFLEYERKSYTKRAPEDRIKDWNEIRVPNDEKELKIQGARCMDCGIPFCHAGIDLGGKVSGCPLQNLIPEWNELVYRGEWREAYKRLTRTNPFPEFTGRVCPAPCEGACTVGHIDEPVTISNIEYEIIERAYQKGWVKPRNAKLTGKQVAVVGSGPSGLAAAYYLNYVGHEVTVYERNDAAGGLLMYGIPNMKLEKAAVARRLELLKKSGVVFVLNTEIGKDISAKELNDRYDSVILCGGATQARELGVEGNDLNGVRKAVDFLTANTKQVIDPQYRIPPSLYAKDKQVIIIGGGDTGTDCVGTSIRQGCKSVHQFEIMPEPPEERIKATNPWPEWPNTLKIDYGQEEAIRLYGNDPRQYEISTKEIISNDKGDVTEVRTVNISWERNKAGQRYPKEIAGSEKVWKADLVLIAMGFVGPEDTLPNELELERDFRGNVLSEYENFRTNTDKVFVAGDMRRGQSLVVWAMQEGKLAAREVDKYLMGKSSIR